MISANATDEPEIALANWVELLINPAGLFNILLKSLASLVSFSFGTSPSRNNDEVKVPNVTTLAEIEPVVMITGSVKVTVLLPEVARWILLTFNILIFCSIKVCTPPYKYHFIYKETKKTPLFWCLFLF